MDDRLHSVYQELANDLLNDINNISWDKLVLKSDILENNASNISFITYITGNETYQQLSFDTAFSINDLLILLRNIVLKDTGYRIWGLTFTLYPNGKFEIEYDYNKPDDYEETDDVILGDEINQSLDKLGIR